MAPGWKIESLLSHATPIDQYKIQAADYGLQTRYKTQIENKESSTKVLATPESDQKARKSVDKAFVLYDIIRREEPLPSPSPPTML